MPEARVGHRERTCAFCDKASGAATLAGSGRDGAENKGLASRTGRTQRRRAGVHGRYAVDAQFFGMVIGGLTL